MSNPSRRRVPSAPSCAILLAVVGVSGLWAGGATAATYTWTGGAGATWDTTATHWSGGVDPWDSTNGPSNTAQFTTAGSTPMLNNGDVWAGTWQVTGANVYTTLGRTVGAGTLHASNISLGAESSILFSASNLLDGNAVVTAAGNYGRFDLFGTTQTVRGLSSAGASLVIQNSELAAGVGVTNGGTGTLVIQTQAGDNYTTNGYMRNGTGTLALIKNGDGTQTLAGGNITYTGGTTVNGGTLNWVGSSTIGGAVTVNNGGTFSMSGSANLSGGVTVASGGTFTWDTTTRATDAGINIGTIAVQSGGKLNLINTKSVAFGTQDALFNNQVLQGAGTVNQSGGGVVDWWSGTNISGFSGVYNVQNGIFSIQGTTAAAMNTTATVNLTASTGSLDLRTQSFGCDQLTGGGIVGSSYSGSYTLTVGTNNGSSTFDGVIKNGGISGGSATLALTKAGAGTFILTGNNTYTGATTVTGGTLKINAVGTGSNNGNVGGNQLTTSALAVSAGAKVVLNTGGNFSSANGGTTLSGAGTIRLAGGTWWLGNPGGGTAISMSSAGRIEVASGATLKGDYSNANWALNQATLDVAAGGNFDLRNNNATVGALTGGGAVYDNGFNNTLTVGAGDASGMFSGTIGAGGTGVSLTKTGSGTQVLSGALTYGGTTTVNGGILEIVDFVGQAMGAGATVIGPGATLRINVTANAGSTISTGNTGNHGSTGAYSGTGTYTKTGAGAWSMNWSGAGAVSFGSGALIDVQQGALFLGYGGGNWTANKADLNVAAGATFDMWDNASGVFVNGLTGGGTVTRGTGYGAGLGTLTVGVDGGTATFDGRIADASGQIALTKNGAGTQTLTGANTYTGATTISGGTLQISGSGTLGGGSYAGNIADNAALVFASSSNQTLSGQITGTGSLTQSGNSTLTLSNATQTFAGPLTVTRGAVSVTTATGISSNAWNIGVDYGATAPAATGVLSFTNSQDLTGKTLSTFTASGAEASSTPYLNAILALQGGNTGALTVTAPVVANQSIVRVGNTYFLTNSTQTSYIWSGATTGNPIADGAGTWDASTTAQWRDVNSGSTTNATWAGGANIANFGVASGAAGAVTVSGTVNAGGLAFSPSASGTYVLSGGTINFGSNNGVLSANGTDATVNSQLSGSNGLTKYGGGTLTLGGNNNYTGTTTVAAGTLIANSNTALGNSANTVVLSGGTLTIGTGVSATLSQASVATSGTSASTLVLNAGSSLGANAQALNTTLNLAGTGALTIRATNTGGHTTAQDFTGQITGTGIAAGTTALILDGTSATLRYTTANTVANTFTGDVLLKGSVTTQNTTFSGADAAHQNNGFLNNNVTVESGGTWTVVWGGETVQQLNGGGNISLSNQNALNNTGLTVGNNNASGGFYTGQISGGFGVTKTGTGTQTFAGANTYTGITTVGGGTLQVDVNNALGTSAGKTTVSNGATLQLNYVNYATAEALDITGTGVGGTAGALSNIGTSTYAGQINVLAGSTGGATINVGGGTLTLTGGVVKDGTVLTLTGGGTINVNSVISGLSPDSDLVVDGTTANLNAANTYNGPTFIRSNATQGILNANVAGALPIPTRSHLTMDDSGAGGSLLNLGASQEVASLTGAGTSLVTLNANNLTIGAAAGSTTFAGAISGSGQIIKDGASTQVLSGTNTYTGTTTVSAGTLLVNGTHNTGATTNTYSVTGGALGGTGIIQATNTVTIATSGTGVVTGGTAGTVGGPLVAGNIGTLTLTATTVNLSGTYQFDVDYAGAGSADLLNITGATTVDTSGLTFALGAHSAPPAAGSSYYIKIFESNVADAAYAAPGQHNLIGSVPGTNGLASYQSIVTWDNGKTFYLVPEPASFALLAMGSLLLLRRPTRRRGRKVQA